MNLFPDCHMIDCEQRSDEWFAARRGILTASQYGDWLTKSGKVADKARLTAAARCLAEMTGNPDPAPFESDDMRGGVELEPEARQTFMQATGLAVDEIGFCRSAHGWFGCSPDGLILDRGEGLEIKCPRASKLIQYHTLGELPPEYEAQVHGSMAVTGAAAWHFFAYFPGYPHFHIRIERSGYTEAMLDGLKDYSRYYETLAETMRQRQIEQQSKQNNE